MRDIWHKYHSRYFKIVANFTCLTAREIMQNNFEISRVVFMPNITTNHAITYTYTKISRCNFRSVNTDFQFIDNINKGVLINKRFKWLIHIWLVYSICFTKKISETIFPTTPLTRYSLFLFVKIVNKR